MSIEQALQQYPRTILTRTSTPLDYLPHLSQKLNINLYIKRDDLTDLTLGGDKPRKLEYEIAKAQNEGADTLVTCGSSQSNMARLTTAAALKVGMDCALVLSEDEWQAFQGNMLTVYLMGARVKIVKTTDHWDLEQHVSELCDTLKSEGRKPYYIPVSGTTPLGCLGNVRGALEMIEQITTAGIQPDAIYTPFGTGGIFSSMLLALREKGIVCPVLGISINREKKQCQTNLETWWTALCNLLDRDSHCPLGSYEIYDEYIGKEYGDPTEACLDAINLMAKTEGILLDPVYSGKMFAGFLAHHQTGRWQKGQNIILLHSGGVPGLFAYHAKILDHLRKKGINIDK